MQLPRVFAICQHCVYIYIPKLSSHFENHFVFYPLHIYSEYIFHGVPCFVLQLNLMLKSDLFTLCIVYSSTALFSIHAQNSLGFLRIYSHFRTFYFRQQLRGKGKKKIPWPSCGTKACKMCTGGEPPCWNCAFLIPHWLCLSICPSHLQLLCCLSPKLGLLVCFIVCQTVGGWLLTSFYSAALLLFPWLRSAALGSSRLLWQTLSFQGKDSDKIL